MTNNITGIVLFFAMALCMFHFGAWFALHDLQPVMLDARAQIKEATDTIKRCHDVMIACENTCIPLEARLRIGSNEEN